MRPAAPNPHQTVSHRPKPHHLKLLRPKRRRLGCLLVGRLHLILSAAIAKRGRWNLNAYAATCLCIVGAPDIVAGPVDWTQCARGVGTGIFAELAR